MRFKNNIEIVCFVFGRDGIGPIDVTGALDAIP